MHVAVTSHLLIWRLQFWLVLLSSRKTLPRAVVERQVCVQLHVQANDFVTKLLECLNFENYSAFGGVTGTSIQ